MLPVALCGFETWSLKLREEHRLKVLENMALRRIFGPKRVEMTCGWINFTARSFIICSLHQIIWDGQIKEDAMDWPWVTREED
jgi:hypothetical protein